MTLLNLSEMGLRFSVLDNDEEAIVVSNKL